MDNQGEENYLGRGLHLAHLNVRSLIGGSKAELIKLQIASSGLDVFTLSETWLHEAIPDSMLHIQKFSLSRMDRRWRDKGTDRAKRGGGLLCYVREGIQYSDTKYKDLNVSCGDLEMQWLFLSLQQVRPIDVVNVYRPPQGDYKNCCSLITEAFMKAGLKDNTDVFLLGDFNINMDDKNALNSKELLFTTGALGLRQLINAPTRIAYRGGVPSKTMIDLIFSNSDCIREAVVMDINISDHQAVRVTRKKIAIKKEKVEFQGRSYRNYDREEFQRTLSNKSWDNFFDERDPNLLWEIMQSRMLEEIDRMCPIKVFKVNKAREPWVTNEALEAIRDKDRLLKRAKRTGKEEDWAQARRERNRVGRDLEVLRAEFLKQQQEEFKSDPKKFWKAIHTIIPNQKQQSVGIKLRDSETGKDIERADTPGFINKFFTNIGQNLAKLHKDPWVYYGEVNQNDLQEFRTDYEEVSKLCKGINIMKSSGIDKLASRICKDAFTVLTEQLVHIFNCSLQTAVFPDTWKVAKIIPLFKGGDRGEVTNYRPVSLLPLPGKLLEKIVHKKVSEFFDQNDVLSEHQGGFRKGFSTTATIADLTDDLFGNLNQGLTTLASFIDLKKAFDTVNIPILLHKLERAGVRGVLLNWCMNYLRNRQQCTLAEGKTSTLLPVSCGVPQGSVLGPLFFLIYVNDLQYALDDCKLKLYADDTVLYQSGVNQLQAQQRLQTSLNKFSVWCAGNALTINVKKTKIMAFGSRSKVKKCVKASVLLNNEKLKLVPSYKYLGLTLDPTLNYNKHLASVIKCVMHKTMLLGKIKKYLNNDVALKIYKSMILPYMDYADVLFVNAKATDLDKLQRLQNRSLKVCLGRDRFFSTERAHREAKVPMLSDRRRAHTLNFMFKRKSARPDLLNRREIRTRAHDAPLFNIVVPHCEAFKRCVGYHGATAWNNLNPGVRSTGSYKEFKNIQAKVMLENVVRVN